MENQIKRCLKHRLMLKKTLGKQFPTYTNLILEWLRKRRTRSELDTEVYSLMTDKNRNIHTDFLVSLSQLCWGLSSLRIETSTTSLLFSTPALAPVNRPIALTPTSASSNNQNTESSDVDIIKNKIYNDLNLPGLELIRARLYLAAWDSGLTCVDTKVSRLLHLAMRNYLKNILHAAILNKMPVASNEPTQLGGMSLWCTLSRTNFDVPARYGTNYYDKTFIKTL